jgi:hypothetical protein
MAGIFGSSGRQGDPLGLTAALVGIGGAACSVLLWVYQLNPESTFLGKWSAQMVSGGRLSSQLTLLAAVLGVMSIIAAIASSIGGRGRASVVVAIVLGVVSLSFPILSYLNVVSGPLRPSLFQ